MNKNNRAKVDNTRDDFEVRTKFFETKNSLLTDLCDDKDKSAVVQLFIALGAGYFGYVAIGDIFYNKGSGFGIKFVLSCFPNFGQLSALWTILFVSSLMLFIGFQFWGRLRIYLPPRSTLRKIFDAACLIGFASYWMGAFTLTSYIALTGHTAYLCSFVLIVENFRLFAKSYAFVRDCTPKVLENKIKSEEEPYYPKFSNLLYFMFIPTLIYNDSYSRVKTPIRWSAVAQWFVHIFFSINLIGSIMENVFIYELNNYEKFHMMDLIAFTFKFHFVTTVMIILIFYIVLHCLQNMFAEILGFPYRVFYSNWWSSKNFMDYFYKWNTIVRDWFFVYVYLDVYKNLTNNNKLLAKYSVFFLSALFHEIPTSFTCRCFIPVIFLEYFVLVAIVSMIKIKSQIWSNVFFWFSMSFGMTFCLVFYVLEFIARTKCPIDNPTFSTYFIPRMVVCYR